MNTVSSSKTQPDGRDASQSAANRQDDQWQIEVFYDGQCPLCKREINMLRWLDRRNRIRFTDIADPDFSPADYGKQMSELMDHIHGRLPDGTWVTGVEVFRRLYGAVGFAWLVPFTRLPVASHVLDWGYDRFAKNRLKWTGRCRDECRVGEAD